MAEYEAPLSTLIQVLKYKSHKDLAKLLAKMVYWTTVIPETDLITAVPLHSGRQRQRGFNQSEEIAKTLSLLLHKPYYQLLRKRRSTRPQAQAANRQQRLTQLTDQFEIEPLASRLLSDHATLTVLIIDDVLTTGTTLNECAKTLKQAGFQMVHALTIAHGQ